MKREAWRRIARQVPVSSLWCAGMVIVSFLPPAAVRRIFMWLPRWEMTSNPNRRRIPATSVPESRLRRGRAGLQLEGDDDGWRGGEAQFAEVFSLKVQGNSLSKIRRNLVQCSALCDDGKLHAFSDEPGLFSWPYHRFYGMLQAYHRTPCLRTHNYIRLRDWPSMALSP